MAKLRRSHKEKAQETALEKVEEEKGYQDREEDFILIDNWEHRSVRMMCSTCMWFIEKKTNTAHSEVGRCRKNAPSLSGWPVVFETDWCGEHKLDENKL